MTRRPSSSLTGFFFVLFFLAALNLPVYGQTETASIYGSITDPTGAVVPNATVRLIDIDRDIPTNIATDNSGFYTFASVRPGHYQIEVEKSGFKAFRLTGITVNVQDNLEHNFKLALGSASETITVTADAARVNTTDGTVSTVVDRTFADGIPLNGRSFQTLIMLTPGVVVTQTAFDDQGQFSVNGQRADANYFTVDGVSANFGVTAYSPLVQAGGGALPALSVQGGTNSLVSVDAMQEFRVQTSSFAPEYGRTPGGQVSIVTRSGTNQFHATLFEYFRNDVLDANDWFNGYTNTPPLPKAKDRQNDFGGVFGGPILRDKTFFFFSYEGLRLRQPSTQETTVPDNASRQQAATTIQPFLSAFPVQNGAELGEGVAQFNASYSNPSSLNAYSIRLDHVINSKINLFGRYNYSPNNLDLRGPTAPPYTVLSQAEAISSAVHTATLGITELIRPKISNEIRTNYSNHRLGEKYSLDSFGGATPPPDSLVFPAGYSSTNSAFEVHIIGVGDYTRGKAAIDEQRQINLIDNLSVVEGNHQFKFGVDYRWLSPFTSRSLYSQFADFSGVSCPPPPASCSGYAVSGITAVAAVGAFQGDALLSRNLSLYGQDTWKITPRLTLTYGLRWDLNPPLKGKNLANQPFTVTGLNNPATIALAPRGTPLYDTTYGNVAPRIGAALRLGDTPSWGSVLRGGFGIFYDLGSGSLGGVSSYFPYLAQKVLFGAPFPLGANGAPPPFKTTPPVNTMVVADPHLDLPRTYEWNAALEQSIGSSQTLSLSYIGAVGRDLLRNTDLFISPSVNPNFSFIGVTTNSATSDYHALQAKFERRLSQGLQALASYTWSHSIDIASTDAFANYLNTPTAVANPNIDRGNSDFDIRHSFTAGVTYNVPTPGWNNFARAALGGWSVDSFIFARSAPPVNVLGGIYFADGVALNPRPNLVPGIPFELYGSQYPGGKAINNTPSPAGPSCPVPFKGPFCPAPKGTQGDFPRNYLRAFGASQVDLAFQREFHFTERVQLRFRGEFFNIFNHPNFGPPTNSLTSPLFGYSTATLNNSLGSGGANGGLNPLYQIGGPRSIQLALKLQF
ncbi:MAG: TonB-dependent receptor [Acidobacteriaceae bacterium]|nr:TonB-dependent receptor [Acidobacteriaceae bacterium]